MFTSLLYRTHTDLHSKVSILSDGVKASACRLKKLTICCLHAKLHAGMCKFPEERNYPPRKQSKVFYLYYPVF